MHAPESSPICGFREKPSASKKASDFGRSATGRSMKICLLTVLSCCVVDGCVDVLRPNAGAATESRPPQRNIELQSAPDNELKTIEGGWDRQATSADRLGVSPGPSEACETMRAEPAH